MTRCKLNAWLAVLLTGCASQTAPEIQRAPPPPQKLVLPPAFSQPDSPAASVASPPPPIPTPPPSSGASLEQLGGTSASAAGASVPSRPCNLDTCGVILAITHHRGAEKLQPGQALDAAEGPGLYTGSETGGEIVVKKITELWEIQIRMHTGKIRVIQQDFEPFLQVGDPVLVDGNTLKLWN